MSTEVTTHGLDGSLVAPDWAPLSDAEVARLLTGFPALSGPFKLLTVSPRPFSAASVVQGGDQRIFIKRHAQTVRTAEALREEHRFMAHLRAAGAPVADVLADAHGATAIEIDTSTYEVHSIPPGIDLYADALSWTPFVSTAHARSAGELLAKMHRAAATYDAPARINRPLVAGFSIFATSRPEQNWDAHIAARPALAAYLSRAAVRDQALDLLHPFHEELQPHLPALPSLWTHNDLHASNLFWSDASPHAHATALIDFGLCDRTNAVHDIAHAIERNIVEWLTLMNDPAHPDRVRVHAESLWALLEGYESVRPLSAAERAALAPMLALCHAEFALSEADYFLAVLHSQEKARIACQDYLLDHARWWRGPGMRLLNKIRAWAVAPMSPAGARLP